MIYAIIILFIAVAILFKKVNNRVTRYQARNMDVALKGQIQSLGGNLHHKMKKEIDSSSHHMHGHFSSVKKFSHQVDSDSIERDLEIRDILNKLASLHGMEVVLTEVPVDTKPIITSLKGKLLDFMQKMMIGMDTAILEGITEKKLVLRKKVATKKLKVK